MLTDTPNMTPTSPSDSPIELSTSSSPSLLRAEMDERISDRGVLHALGMDLDELHALFPDLVHLPLPDHQEALEGSS